MSTFCGICFGEGHKEESCRSGSFKEPSLRALKNLEMDALGQHPKGRYSTDIKADLVIVRCYINELFNSAAKLREDNKDLRRCIVCGKQDCNMLLDEHDEAYLPNNNELVKARKVIDAAKELCDQSAPPGAGVPAKYRSAWTVLYANLANFLEPNSHETQSPKPCEVLVNNKPCGKTDCNLLWDQHDQCVAIDGSYDSMCSRWTMGCIAIHDEDINNNSMEKSWDDALTFLKKQGVDPNELIQKAAKQCERDLILGKNELTKEDEDKLNELNKQIGINYGNRAPEEIEAMEIIKRAAASLLETAAKTAEEKLPGLIEKISKSFHESVARILK